MNSQIERQTELFSRSDKPVRQARLVTESANHIIQSQSDSLGRVTLASLSTNQPVLLGFWKNLIQTYNYNDNSKTITTKTTLTTTMIKVKDG